MRVFNFNITHTKSWYKTNKYNSLSGFTLVEMLITISIIGIIAAITIPQILYSYRKIIIETGLKRFYSTFNQAIMKSINDNGDIEYWVPSCLGSGNIDKSDAYFQKYLAPYLRIADKKEVIDADGKKRIIYYFPDGSGFSYMYHECRDFEFMPQNPEKCLKRKRHLGTCSFMFELYPEIHNDFESIAWKYLKDKNYIQPFLYSWNGTKDWLYNNSNWGCNKNIVGDGYLNNTSAGAYCTAIIYLNGWKIPKDYPLNL